MLRALLMAWLDLPHGRRLLDRLLPGVFFGATALVGGANALNLAWRGLPDRSIPAALAHVLDVAHPILTSLFCGLVAALFLIRGEARGGRARPPALAVALVGTFIMGAVAIQPVTTRDWRLLALSDALLVGGVSFAIYAAASLRVSFGLAPEARELVTSGAYRLVRHPIYVGELVAATGALLPVLAPSTVLIFAIFCVSQFARAVLEVRVLTAAFPQYVDYRRRTPALVPWPRPAPRSARPSATPVRRAGRSALLDSGRPPDPLANAVSGEDEDREPSARDRVEQQGDDEACQ